MVKIALLNSAVKFQCAVKIQFKSVYIYFYFFISAIKTKKSLIKLLTGFRARAMKNFLRKSALKSRLMCITWSVSGYPDLEV